MASAEVQLAPVGWAAAGAAGVAAISAFDQLPAVGWFAALAYVIVSNALLLHGLRRRGAGRFGWANVVTATRSALVACITGLVAASFVEPISVPLMVGLAIPALALDAVDGWVARGTGSTTELGARFDMEVDAFLLLVLSLYVAPILGPWVLTIGLMRYVFVAAGWGLPWLRVELPPRYWRKVVTAAQGIALTFAASGLFPQLAGVLVAVALALLVESFGRDVAWLALRGRARRAELGAS